MDKEKRLQQVPPVIFWVEESGSGEVCYCPTCGAILDAQEGFSPDLETWICKECHQVLYGDVYDGEDYPGILWWCDECGDLLNRQKGFHDTGEEWACTKCGHIEHFDLILDFQPFGQADPDSKEE